MAIYLYCEKCYTSNPLSVKACSNCGAEFGRSKRYRVCVSYKGLRGSEVVRNLTIARDTEDSLKEDLKKKHRGEKDLFKLTWDDVDFERGMIILREPKGGKTQTIPVSPGALEVLRGLEVTSPYVFPGKDGGQRTDFKGPWLRIRKAAGLPDNFRFHGLRHHFASTLVSAGYDLLVVQKLLTHQDSRTTQRYARLSPGALKEAALKSADLLNPKANGN